jgi:DNA modification methylase
VDRRVNISNAIQGEYDENVERADFALQDIAAIFKEVQKTRIGHRPTRTRNKVSNLDSLSSSSSSSFPRGSSLEVAGKIAGYSHGNMAKIVALTRAAEEDPDGNLGLGYDNRTKAELVEDVDQGKTRLSKAYILIKHSEERIKTRAQLEQSARGKSLSNRVTLLNKEVTKLDELIIEIPDNSVDLIITDPPYLKDDLPVFDALAKLAVRKLKEGGNLIFYFGQYNLEDVIILLSKYKNEGGLFYQWQLAVINSGSQARFHCLGVQVGWKLMLWYKKRKNGENNNDQEMSRYGSYKPAWQYQFCDVIYSARPDKAIHEWAQSPDEAEYVIKNLTISEDALVVDPFLGSGAFVIPAIKLGRYVIGIEKDKQVYDNAVANIKSQTGIAANSQVTLGK